MNQSFTNFLATVITIFVLILWIIPAFMMYHGGNSGWGFVYFPVILVTMTWGVVIAKKYFDWR